MADRGDADFPEVLRGQAGQDPGVDVVVAERPLVPAQAQPAQPSPNVHLPSPIGRACPDGRSLSRTAVERVMERHERSAFPLLTASKPVALAFDGGHLTLDTGVLVLAEVERRLGLAERLARCLADPRAAYSARDPAVRHTFKLTPVRLGSSLPPAGQTRQRSVGSTNKQERSHD